MKNLRFVAFSTLFLIFSAVIAEAAAEAQQQPAKLARTAAVQPAAADQLSAQLQRQLEAENARTANPACGSNCQAVPGAKLKNPGGGDGGLRYTCNSGNCACSGACQCVAMEEICMPDTIGCSDYGCSCKKKSGAEPEEPNC